MPLVYWSTQTMAAINLLRPEQTTNTVYLPYVSTANAAATIIQHAYTKYTNHFLSHQHQLVLMVSDGIHLQRNIINLPPKFQRQTSTIPPTTLQSMTNSNNLMSFLLVHRQSCHLHRGGTARGYREENPVYITTV
jgi:hypothetical protein